MGNSICRLPLGARRTTASSSPSGVQSAESHALARSGATREKTAGHDARSEEQGRDRDERPGPHGNVSVSGQHRVRRALAGKVGKGVEVEGEIAGGLEAFARVLLQAV